MSSVTFFFFFPPLWPDAQSDVCRPFLDRMSDPKEKFKVSDIHLSSRNRTKQSKNRANDVHARSQFESGNDKVMMYEHAITHISQSLRD